MTRSWTIRFLLMVCAVVISLASLYPTLTNQPEDSTFPLKKKINLGLDLQGGLYMVLGIDFPKVFKDELKVYVNNISNSLEDEGIQTEIGSNYNIDVNDPVYEIVFTNPSDITDAKTKVKEWGYQIRLVKEEGSSVFYGFTKAYRYNVQENAVSKSIEVIRNRIDEFGVNEPEIFSQGDDRIIVQLPGVKDIDRAKNLIGQTAKLEFKLVNSEFSAGKLNEIVEKAKAQGIEFKKGDRFSEYVAKINEIGEKDIPKNHTIVFEKKLNRVTNEIDSMTPILVQSSTDLTGEELDDAHVSIDPQDNSPFVSMTFNTKGANSFEKITGDNVGKQLAIILDNNVYSAPSIRSRIPGGNARIDMGSSGNRQDVMREATDLSLVLRAGALPVELEFQEQRIVGPSLGTDSIASARTASIIGMIFVFLFTLFYYKKSGAIAVTTLAINVLLVLACLVGFEATLTLPGIAGIALTVGMAVDGNIIIFERIKEEFAAGTPAREAVETGFAKAFWTILDANLTTAAAGICLINFGTGPIRGFAVTLLIGIVSTVYTSYFLGKLLFELYLTRTKQVSI